MWQMMAKALEDERPDNGAIEIGTDNEWQQVDFDHLEGTLGTVTLVQNLLNLHCIFKSRD